MFWERSLPSCGHNLCVRFAALLSFAGTTIGNNVLINRYTFVGLLDIGHNVMIANHCTLLGGRYQHRAGRAWPCASRGWNHDTSASARTSGSGTTG